MLLLAFSFLSSFFAVVVVEAVVVETSREMERTRKKGGGRGNEGTDLEKEQVNKECWCIFFPTTPNERK